MIQVPIIIICIVDKGGNAEDNMAEDHLDAELAEYINNLSNK